MLTDERHAIIAGRLASEGRVLAAELASAFGVSEDTIRRDLRDLARAGACRRVYGGAVAPAPYAGPHAMRDRHEADAKAALAKAAVRLLTPGLSLFIDAGTTNTAIARAIPLEAELTVATNSIAVAAALSDHPLVALVVLGGPYDREGGATLGGDAVRAVGQIRADLVFLGACGVDAARGVTAFAAAEAEVKRAMVRNSGGVVIAATTGKLATAAPFRVAETRSIRHLVVEAGAPADALAAFESQGCTVHRAAAGAAGRTAHA